MASNLFNLLLKSAPPQAPKPAARPAARQTTPSPGRATPPPGSPPPVDMPVVPAPPSQPATRPGVPPGGIWSETLGRWTLPGQPDYGVGQMPQIMQPGRPGGGDPNIVFLPNGEMWDLRNGPVPMASDPRLEDYINLALLGKTLPPGHFDPSGQPAPAAAAPTPTASPSVEPPSLSPPPTVDPLAPVAMPPGVSDFGQWLMSIIGSRGMGGWTGGTASPLLGPAFYQTQRSSTMPRSMPPGYSGAGPSSPSLSGPGRAPSFTPSPPNPGYVPANPTRLV